MDSVQESSRPGSEVAGSASAPTEVPTQDEGPVPTDAETSTQIEQSEDQYAGYPEVAVPFEIRRARTRSATGSLPASSRNAEVSRRVASHAGSQKNIKKQVGQV